MELIGRRDPLESGQSIGIAAGHKISAAQVVPETLRVIGIEAHGLQYPLNALLRLAYPGQHLALLNHDEIVIGIEREGAFLVLHGLLMLVLRQAYGSADAMHVAVVIVEPECRLQLAGHDVPGSFAVAAPAIGPGLANR